MNDKNQQIRQYKKIQRMAEGLDHFQDKVYPARKGFFQKLAAAKQEPVITLITCSDSRIETHELLQNRPGEIFMVRNVGNMVNEEARVAIEYSIIALDVRLVFVMGHQQCGAMKAIVHPDDSLQKLPRTQKYVSQALRANTAAAKLHHELSDEEKLTSVIRENVIEQVLRVKTFVADEIGYKTDGAAAGSMEDLQGLSDNEVRVVGIVYNIGKGTVDVCRDTDSVNPVWEDFNAKTFLHRPSGFTQVLKEVTATIGMKLQQFYQALLSK